MDKKFSFSDQPMKVKVSCFDKSTYTFDCLDEFEDYAGSHNLDIKAMNFEMTERESTKNQRTR